MLTFDWYMVVQTHLMAPAPPPLVSTCTPHGLQAAPPPMVCTAQLCASAY